MYYDAARSYKRSKINLRLWRGAFQLTGSDLAVRRYRPDFEFWHRAITERQEKVIHSNLSEVSRQRIGRNCVCACLRALVEHQVTRLQ